MSIKNKLIEKYLTNNLSQEEKNLFDKMFNEDNSFREEFFFQKDLKKAVLKKDQDDFKKLILSIEKRNSSKLNKFSYKWLIAASLILFFGITFFMQLNNKYNPNIIFKENFIPYKNVIYPINRGSKIISEDIKIKAFLAYENGKYSKAASLFSQLYEQTKESYYLFYKANSLLKTGKIKDAIPVLKEHLKTKDSLSDKSNWYLALAYIKLNDTEKAKELLRIIHKKELYNYKKAKVILKKLP